jgi:hypothetical protein
VADEGFGQLRRTADDAAGDLGDGDRQQRLEPDQLPGGQLPQLLPRQPHDGPAVHVDLVVHGLELFVIKDGQGAEGEQGDHRGGEGGGPDGEFCLDRDRPHGSACRA